MDGRRLDGMAIRCEFARPRGRRYERSPPRMRGFVLQHQNPFSMNLTNTRIFLFSYRPPQRTPYRARFDNLPRKMSWQDLKDHIRPVAEASYAEIRPGRNSATG